MPISDPPLIPKVLADPEVGGGNAKMITTVNTVQDPAALPNIDKILESPTAGMYVGYGSAVVYDSDKGLRPQPVAAGPNAALIQFTRVHSGMTFKGVAAVAVTIGRDPDLPAADTGNVNDVLLDENIQSISPGKMPDGSSIYVTMVKRLYALQRMPSASDPLDRGATPVDINNAPANTLNPASVFDTNLMGPAATVTNPPSGGITY